MHIKGILKRVDKYLIPWKLKNIIRSYLINRKVMTKNNICLNYNVGIPQGSTLENIVVDDYKRTIVVVPRFPSILRPQTIDRI